MLVGNGKLRRVVNLAPLHEPRLHLLALLLLHEYVKKKQFYAIISKGTTVCGIFKNTIDAIRV